MAKPRRPTSVKEKLRRISRGVALWNKTERKWGVYRKSDKDQNEVLLWLGSDKDAARYCQNSNLKLPEELRTLAVQLKIEDEAKRKKEHAKWEQARARYEKKREKYLEGLSEKDRKDVLKREDKREADRNRRPGMTILEIVDAEEAEEVFPWEKK